MTSQRVEWTWIRTGGYGRFRGEWVNDLSYVSSLTQSLLFADDTSMFCSHKDANHLVSIVNNELAKIIIWLKVNKLSLNLAKTNSMIFHPRQKKVNVNVALSLEIL